MAPKAIFAVLAVVLVARVNARNPQKIVNGNLATLGEFPYQASLRFMGQHFCAGTIVSLRHIMTAAHCVANNTMPMTVVTGTISSSDGDVHTPIKTDYHDQFTGIDNTPFDIAVITLARDITFNAVQNKIALPTAPAPIGVMATATGWGSQTNAFPIATPTLNKIQLRTISGEQCQRMFGDDEKIYPNQVCTYNGPGSGICWGDSGGPLVFNGELIGIISWVIPCAVGKPDVSTSVYHLLPWINSIINA